MEKKDSIITVEEAKILLSRYPFQSIPGSFPWVPIDRLDPMDQQYFGLLRLNAVNALEMAADATDSMGQMLLLEVLSLDDIKLTWIGVTQEIPRLQPQTKVAAILTPGLPPKVTPSETGLSEAEVEKIDACAVGAFYYGFRPVPDATDDTDCSHKFAILSRKKVEEFTTKQST
jgi:hypothetical protein